MYKCLCCNEYVLYHPSWTKPVAHRIPSSSMYAGFMVCDSTTIVSVSEYLAKKLARAEGAKK